MTVSSVKNLNGETFSAVQDASLTDIVSSNSANWNEISAYQANSASYLQNSDLTIVDNKITEISGVPLSAGDELPEVVSAAADYVSATSANINATIDNVSANSGVWGGSALPISAGPGVKVELVDNTLVFSNDETVLYSSTGGIITAFNLNEAASAFNTIKVYWKWNDSVDQASIVSEIVPDSTAFNLSTMSNYNSKYYTLGKFEFNSDYTDFTYVSGWQAANDVPGTATPIEKFISIRKVIGINRVSGGN